MKLVYASTGNEVKVGDKVKMQDGRTWTLSGIEKPHKPSSTGRVYVVPASGRACASYFPSVIGAEWIEREDQ